MGLPKTYTAVNEIKASESIAQGTSPAFSIAAPVSVNTLVDHTMYLS